MATFKGTSPRAVDTVKVGVGWRGVYLWNWNTVHALLAVAPTNNKQGTSTRSSVIMANTTSFLGGMVHALAQGAGWKAWTPSDPPWPKDHPLGKLCRDGRLGLHLPRANGSEDVLHQEMCLAHDDFVSDRIVARGSWRDCGMYVRLWQGLDGHLPMSRAKLPRPKPGDPEGVLLEIGANIGACTVELLLRTNAKIVAIEPSPANVFFLTRTLRMMAAQYPQIKDRVVVFPVGIGGVPSSRSRSLLVPPGNLGNSMLQTTARSDLFLGASLTSELAGASRLEVVLSPLHELFPNGLGGIRAVKVDTQGYECQVLLGSIEALRHTQSRVEALVTEVARKHLAAHCCTPAILTHLMRAIGVPEALVGQPSNSSSFVPHSMMPRLNAKGLYRSKATGGDATAELSRDVSGNHAWNVSCDGQSLRADERSCIARPWNHSRGAPPPYQLMFEREDLPQPRWRVMDFQRECEKKCEQTPVSANGKSTAAAPRCCQSPEPEPGKAGRCAHRLVAISKSGKADGKCTQRLIDTCPVACGACLICTNHTLYSFYIQLLSKVPKPPHPEHYQPGLTALREAKLNAIAAKLDARGIDAAEALESVGSSSKNDGKTKRQLTLMLRKIEALEKSNQEIGAKLAMVMISRSRELTSGR